MSTPTQPEQTEEPTGWATREPLDWEQAKEYGKKAAKALREWAASVGVDLDRIPHYGGGPDCPPDWKPSTQSTPLSAEEQAELTARIEASIDRAVAEAAAAFPSIHYRFATEEEVARNPNGLVWTLRPGPERT